MSQLSNAYVEAFLTKKPKEGIAIVQARLKDSMALDMELAEYFKERAQIEENYAKSLAKASKRLYTMDLGVLGHFAPIWELLLKEFNQIANYHSEMAYKITQDIEKPLRASPSDDYHRLQQMEHMIHSLENKNKLSSVRGSLFRKSSSASSLSSAKVKSGGTWENEGVEYLNLNQSIDEARLHRLKKSVEKFEQIQSDQLMKRVELANMTLSVAEVFEIQHDMRDFCNERGKGLVTIKPPTTQGSSRPGVATVDSHDSQRSTTSSSGNKFKSVFMKKKKQQQNNNFENQQEYQQQQQHGYSPATAANSYNKNASSISEGLSSNSMVSTEIQNNLGSVPATATTSNEFRPIINNSALLIDADGYSVPPPTSGQFPTIASDISSRNTSDDFDSDYQSMKVNPRLQINIKDNVVNKEDNQANESFNKMANMLRERTPTITRKARGRRESAVVRSQTDSSIYNNTVDSPNLHSNSMLSNSSNDTSNSNPFMQQQQQLSSSSPTSSNFINMGYSSNSPQLLKQHSPVTLVDPPMSSVNNNSWQLQPILEDQQSQQPAQVLFSIFEKTNMVDEQHILLVQGQVSITYIGPTTNAAPVNVRLSQIDGVQRLTPNPQYIHATATTENYTLDTMNIPQGQPIVCFTYQVKLNGDGRWALPIHLSPSWKCVQGITYLMIKHSKNGNYNNDIKGNVQVLYDQVTSVQSTPQGIWDLNKRRLTWQMKDLFEQYSSENQQRPRLLAKFFIEEGQTGTPQPIYINYLVKNHSATGLTVNAVQEDSGSLIKQSIETSVQSENIVIF